MIHARAGTEVLENLQPVISPGSGIEHRGASYFGPRYSTSEASSQPQALMTQMCANETILPPAWSMVFVEPGEEIFEIKAGANGLEALVMQFPRDDD